MSKPFRTKFLVYKIEEGALVVDSFFNNLPDAEWKAKYLRGEEGSRIGEPSLGDYQVEEVTSHE